KDDQAIEILAEPGEDLLEARGVVMALAAQRRIGDKENAALHADRRPGRKGVERLDVDRQAAQGAPVPPGVLDQRTAFRPPDRPSLAATPAVENARGDLLALADPGAVTDEIAHAIGAPLGVGMQERSGAI